MSDENNEIKINLNIPSDEEIRIQYENEKEYLKDHYERKKNRP